MPNKTDIIKTTWISLALTLFIIYFAFASIAFYNSYFIDSSNFLNSFTLAFFGSAVTVLLYYSIFWIPLWVVLIIIEYILLTYEASSLKNILNLESVVLVILLIGLAILNNESIFLAAALAVLIAQRVRSRLILRTQ